MFLFFLFAIFRLAAILVRNYYDLHVYNFFRFVQTAIQAWIFEDVSKLRLWQKIGASEQQDTGAADSRGSPKDQQDQIRDSEAQVINILTKDIEVFTNGSWQFPYLIVVPVNTIASAIILVNMYGPIVILCYIMMAGLLILQYFSNKKLASL